MISAPAFWAVIAAGLLCCAAGFAVLRSQERRHDRESLPRDHRDGCPCAPCREFDTAADEALAFSAGHVPGLPRDGHLSWRERRVLRGIERAARRDDREPEGSTP